MATSSGDRSMGPESNRLQCGVRFAFPLHRRVCSLVRAPGIAQRPNCRLDSSRLSGMSRNYLTGPTAPVRSVLLLP